MEFLRSVQDNYREGGVNSAYNPILLFSQEKRPEKTECEPSEDRFGEKAIDTIGGY